MFHQSGQILPDHISASSLLDTTGIVLYGEGSYELIRDWQTKQFHGDFASQTFDDNTSVTAKEIEQRYKSENQMMDAVSHGDFEKAIRHPSTFHIEQRQSNPLRDMKNFMIVVNTLLRKGDRTRRRPSCIPG